MKCITAEDGITLDLSWELCWSMEEAEGVPVVEKGEDKRMGSDHISSDPLQRLTFTAGRKSRSGSPTFDMHCHIFNKDYVPDRFLRINLPMKAWFLGGAEWLLHRVIGSRDTDKLSSLAYFLDIIAEKEMENIALRVLGYYDNHALFGPDTVICPLMMDFQPRKGDGIRGKTKKDFYRQIDEIKNLAEKYPGRILPFLAIDPRRPRMLEDIFLPAFETSCFGGVKLYPSLGYLLSHPVLLEMYEICEEKNIPVTVHCGTGSVRSSRSHLRNIPGLRYDQKNPEAPAEMGEESRWLLSKEAFAGYFNHPDRWRPVLERFPRLRLNLAHFGSTLEWDRYLKGKSNSWPSRIMDLIYRYPHVYTDISYNICDSAQYAPLRELLLRNPRLRERVLYGSDYFMVVKEGHFRTMLAEFTTAMGEDLMVQMNRKNPSGFLGIG